MRASLAGKPWMEVGLAGVLAFALFFAGTARIPILGLDEGRFSQAAREMLDRGDPVVPTFLGEGRYHKPILIYWCTMTSYAVLGVTERAARLPANVAGALAVMVLAWTARRRYGPGAGALAGGALAVTMVFHVQAKACTADMVMLLPTLVMMLAFERILLGASGGVPAVLFWVGLSVSVLAKGPIAPLWVLATSMALWAFGRRWRVWELLGMTGLLAAGAWWAGPGVLVVPAAWAAWSLIRSPKARSVVHRLRFGWGVPLAILLILPWIVAVERATGGAFLREAVGTHVVSRSTSSFESHGFFPGFYLVTAPLVLFPWFASLADVFGRGRQVLAAAESRYHAAWLLGPLVVMELVQTKLVHYWMPSYPAGILLVVGWALAARSEGRTGGRASRLLVGLGGAVLGVLPPALAVHLELGGPLMVVALLAAAVMFTCTAVAVWLGGRKPERSLAVLVAGTAGFLAVLFGGYLPMIAEHSLPPRAGRRAAEVVRPGERVVVFKPRDDDLYFYLPLGSRACGEVQCLADTLRAGGGGLGLTRAASFELLLREWPDVRLELVDRVAGIDLNRMERGEVVLFRVGERTTGAGEDRRDVDRQRAPS